MQVPHGISDSAALTLSCNLPTAIIANHLVDIQAGEAVAVVGCGPTGLMTLDAALHRGPERAVALNKVPHRLASAAKKGAFTINSAEDGWK